VIIAADGKANESCGDDNLHGAALLRRLSSTRSCPSSGFIFKIEVANLQAKDYLFGMDRRGLHETAIARFLLVVVSLVKSESLAWGVVMTMTLVSNLDDGPRLHCVCAVCV
jgi:hypothetical protein